MKELFQSDEYKRHLLGLGYGKMYSPTFPLDVKIIFTLCDRYMEVFEDSSSVARFDSLFFCWESGCELVVAVT